MTQLLHLFASVSLGLYAGALLTEALILVPYWRTMEPKTFFGLHHTMGPNLFRFFAPLTTITVVLVVLSAAFTEAGSAMVPRQLAAAGGLIALLIFFVYFKGANQSFADRSITNAELAATLRSWSRWHWARTIIIIGAFAASAIA